MKPAIFGLSGTCLTADERAFFRDAAPVGFILFARNIVDPDQLRALTDDLRALSGRADTPILVDQEGGRVTRLGPPIWPALPAGERFARLYQVAPISAIEAMRAHAGAIAATLRASGINVNCMPMLDLRLPGSSPIVGDRALGSDPIQVAALGRAALDGLAAGGVVGVIKHMPGHGRATLDSHHALPVVEASADELETDLAPFRALAWAPIGMTAHVIYTAWDAERPATLSTKVIAEVIRGRIGFEGLLMSDDIVMGALTGAFGERAAGALAAGCDLVLHCSGELDEMETVAGELGEIGPEAERRLERAMASVAAAPKGRPAEELAAKRDSLLAYS
jgi:beta-N-acetylhexosaminidase